VCSMEIGDCPQIVSRIVYNQGIMEPLPSETAALLVRVQAGDRQALDALLARNLPWIRAQVRRRMGAALRSKEESSDVVQDAVIEFLTYGPRIRLESEAGFRGLMCRIVEHTLRDRRDWWTARRRALSRERPLGADTVLDLDAPRAPGPDPAEEAARREWEAWIRLGMELLDAGEREVIVLRKWEGRDWAAVGRALGCSEDAARMRFNRAMASLADAVHALRAGAMPAAADDAAAGDAGGGDGRE